MCLLNRNRKKTIVICNMIELSGLEIFSDVSDMNYLSTYKLNNNLLFKIK